MLAIVIKNVIELHTIVSCSFNQDSSLWLHGNKHLVSAQQPNLFPWFFSLFYLTPQVLARVVNARVSCYLTEAPRVWSVHDESDMGLYDKAIG